MAPQFWQLIAEREMYNSLVRKSSFQISSNVQYLLEPVQKDLSVNIRVI